MNSEGLAELRSWLEGSGLHVDGDGESEQRLTKLRAGYEHYAVAISYQLALDVPDWLPEGEVRENWRVAEPRKGDRLLP